MKKVSIGIIIGFLLSMSTVIFASDVKEYILKKVSYPILVNGVIFTDPDLPALNYQGNTYLPLKAIGETLGTTIYWNKELGRIEIDNLPIDSSKEPEILQDYKNSGKSELRKLDNENSIMKYEEFKNMFSVGTILKGISNDELTVTLTYKGNLSKHDFDKVWFGMEKEVKKKLAEQLGAEIQAKNPEYEIAINFKFSEIKLGYVLAYKNGYQISSFQEQSPTSDIQQIN